MPFMQFRAEIVLELHKHTHNRTTPSSRCPVTGLIVCNHMRPGYDGQGL